MWLILICRSPVGLGWEGLPPEKILPGTRKHVTNMKGLLLLDLGSFGLAGSITSNSEPAWGLQAEGKHFPSWAEPETGKLPRRLSSPVDGFLFLSCFLLSVRSCPGGPALGRLISSGSTWHWLETLPPVPRVLQAPDTGTCPQSSPWWERHFPFWVYCSLHFWLLGLSRIS